MIISTWQYYAAVVIILALLFLLVADFCLLMTRVNRAWKEGEESLHWSQQWLTYNQGRGWRRHS
jgi:hypothetical protein